MHLVPFLYAKKNVGHYCDVTGATVTYIGGARRHKIYYSDFSLRNRPDNAQCVQKSTVHRCISKLKKLIVTVTSGRGFLPSETSESG